MTGLLFGLLAAGAGAGAQTPDRRPARPVPKRSPSLLDQARKQGAAAPRTPINITGRKNEIVVTDPQGRTLLQANSLRLRGRFQPGAKENEPIHFETAKCRMFQKGKPEWDLASPDATWDGERLLARKSATADSADGKLKIVSTQATWDSNSGALEATQAKMESLERGRVEFRAGGPLARVVGSTITLPRGGSGENSQGEKMQAGHLVWKRDTGQLTASRGVVLQLTRATITGPSMTANTRLQKGRFKGRTRMVLRPAAPLAAAKGKKP